MPDGGSLVKPSDLNTFEFVRPRDDYEFITLGIDGASSLSEDASYSAIVVVGVIHNQFHILNAWRGHVEFGDFKDKVYEYIDKFDPTHIGIEAASSGITLYQLLCKELDGGVFYHKPREDKEYRFQKIFYTFVEGRVCMPGKILKLKGIGALRKELLEFPNGKTDDLVDALVYAIMMAMKAPRAGQINNVPKKPTRKFFHLCEKHGYLKKF
jgi:phage terminase large subunit-like protein